jgi:iron(III) transport system permease protein
VSVAATRPRVVSGPVRARMRWGLLAWAAAVTAVMLLPLVYLGVRASEAEAASWELILRSRTAWLALRSVGLAAAVTGSAAIIGVPLAWLTARTDLPNRRLWSVAVALPLVFPSYVGAFALIAALGPRGMLQQLLEGPLGVTALPDISGFVGAWLALTLFTYPYVYLMAAAGIKGLDPACEEAARSLGRSSWTTFWRVTLPQLRPSIAAGCLLVALYTLHDFGAVSLMRFQAFTQAIYLQYRGAFDRAPAAILSLMLVLLALGVLVMERRARGRARYFRAGPGSRRPVRPVALGGWKWPALALCGAVAGAALVLPLGVISFWLARGVLQGSGASLSWAAAGASVLVSSMGAVVAVAAAVPVALLAARHAGPTTAVVERLAYSGYALPGIVVALAFVFAAANFAPALYQSVPLVVIAYMVLFLPQAVEPLRTSLLQVGPRAEEAARALGVTKAQAFRRVVAPLVGRGAMAGAALVFLTSMKELPATLLLRPTGFETLATRVWTGATAGLYSKAAAPAWLLILICAVPLYFLTRRIEVEEAQ